ncbi:hypothetical protein PRIPAC_95432 [Pristionchus pacificus]|uniref:Dehydrogenase n=1 Tax=Pristionchus pacificus TaxID=54126 RepID=A0A2A6D1I4_PRIPA|nr:hypothetical protein PRIPAC_95432 [Pristionchus pacificus]|eukprot:PDM84143.1 dehydrogenase [Pristionchus pacificus]
MPLKLGLLWLLAIPGVLFLIYSLSDLSFILGLAVSFLIFQLYFVGQRILKQFDIDALENRAVFITGCDTGFGQALAIKLLERGIPTFAGCLTEKGADNLKNVSNNLPGKLQTIIIDVTSDDSVQRAAKQLDKATEKYGGVHALVNNAGIVGSSFFDDLVTTREYKDVAEVNTFGVIRVTQAMKHLVKKTKGRIVTMSSICDRVGIMGFGPYSVSKYAVTGYCEVIRQELSFFDVSVHIIEPGFFKTPMIDPKTVQNRLDTMWKMAPLSIKEEYGEKFYRDSRERTAELLEKIGSQDIHLVVNGYYHAITSRFPRLRYQIGGDAKFFFLPLSLLPCGLRDAIFRVIDKVSGAPVPASASR